MVNYSGQGLQIRHIASNVFIIANIAREDETETILISNFVIKLKRAQNSTNKVRSGAIS